jgi:hypothetical protein
MRTPPTFVLFRVTAVTITVLVLLLFGTGLGGLGPLDGLSAVTSHALNWLQINTGVTTR